MVRRRIAEKQMSKRVIVRFTIVHVHPIICFFRSTTLICEWKQHFIREQVKALLIREGLFLCL